MSNLYHEEKVQRTRAPNLQYEMEASLREWGRWKRNYVIGLGFKSSTIEHQIMRGEVFGDGCIGGKKGGGSVTILESEVGEKIDLWVRKLTNRHPNECQVLKMAYIMQWSNRKIALKAEISRSQTLKLKTRGILLLMGMEFNRGSPGS